MLADIDAPEILPLFAAFVKVPEPLWDAIDSVFSEIIARDTVQR